MASIQRGLGRTLRKESLSWHFSGLFTHSPPPAAVSQTLSTPRLRGLTFNRRGTECFHCPILTRRSGWERGRIVPTLNIKGSFVSASPSAQVRQMSANSGHTRHKIPDEHQLASTESICFKLAAKLHSLRCCFYMAVSYRSVISGVNVPFFPSFFNMWHKFKLLFLPFIHGGLKALKVLLSVSFYSSCLCLSGWPQWLPGADYALGNHCVISIYLPDLIDFDVWWLLNCRRQGGEKHRHTLLNVWMMVNVTLHFHMAARLTNMQQHFIC